MGTVASKTKLKRYIGTKIVEAMPMTLGTYKKKGGQTHSTQNDKTSGYKVVYPDGYESWSPKNVFEESYSILEYGFDIGKAIELISHGYKVGNSKLWLDNCFIYLQDGTQISPEDGRNDALKTRKNDIIIHQHIDKYVGGTLIVGWTPNILELFSNDFYIYEN
jgi:hypothetical protein